MAWLERHRKKLSRGRTVVVAGAVCFGCSLTNDLGDLSSGSAGASGDAATGGTAGAGGGAGSAGTGGVVDSGTGAAAGSDSGTDAPLVCEQGETRCGDECVTVASDVGHCGGCNAACTAPPGGTSVCVAGRCDFVCGSLLRCGEVCVDGDVDPTSCGGCGNVCTGVEFGDPECTSGSCSARCDAGFDFCDGRCVDLQGDPDHCGVCDNACSTGRVCALGMCADSCPAGLVACSGACVDPSVSPLHCGGCGVRCTSPPNGAAACVAGTCGVTCDTGFTDCAGACVDENVDPAHCGGCGNTCDPPAQGTASCVGAECTNTCNAGFARCADRCVNLNSNPSHCGGCDQACDTTELCSQAQCNAACTGGLTACSGFCVDTTSDPDHCGGCDVGCAQPTNGMAVCATGTCGIACNGGLTDCGGACVDTANDPSSCGSCTTVCSPPSNGTATCTGGMCGGACGPGFSLCGTDCVDLQTSVAHCGSCGMGCTGGEVCSNSQCTLACGAGEQNCGGSCVDTQSDTSHCGACGNPCTNPNGSTSCSGGACLFSCSAGWASCDADATNGCEQDVGSDPSHCGACGNVCPPSASECRDGNCVPAPITVSTAFFHTCASRPSGAIACWGRNLVGQLGNGTTTESHVPVAVVGFTDSVQPATKTYDAWASSCGLHASGQASCWGHREHGQLGDGSGNGGNTPTKKTVVNLADAVQLSAGDDHVCAVRRTGSVACWGDKGHGRLGNGTTSGYSDVPLTVPGITSAIQVSAGDRHTCVVLATGGVLCWGDRGRGRVGDGSTSSNALVPVAVPGIANAAQVSAGREHTCVVLLDGTARCWGNNDDDRIGDGSSTSGDQLTPAVVSGLTDAVQIAAGAQHTCAVRQGGGVVCWGRRSDGRVGNGGSTSGTSPTPVAVSILTDAVSVDAGDRHTCAATLGSAVFCWGHGTDGKLGDGATSSRTEPVQVVMLPP